MVVIGKQMGVWKWSFAGWCVFHDSQWAGRWADTRSPGLVTLVSHLSDTDRCEAVRNKRGWALRRPHSRCVLLSRQSVSVSCAKQKNRTPKQAARGTPKELRACFAWTLLGLLRLQVVVWRASFNVVTQPLRPRASAFPDTKSCSPRAPPMGCAPLELHPLNPPSASSETRISLQMTSSKPPPACQ